MPTRPINGWMLFFVIFYLVAPQLALDLYLPSIPSMVSALHGSTYLVQLSIAIYLLGIAASQFFYGPLSDNIGRRPIVIIGCSIAVAGSILCVIATNIDVFIFGRLVQGIGLGFGSILGRAIIRDCVEDKKTIAKLISYQSMAWSCVPLLAPVIGGYIQHWFSWRANFIILLAVSLLLLITNLVKLRETRLPAQRRPFRILTLLRTYGFLLKHFNLLGYMLIIALQYGALITILQLSPFIFQTKLGFSANTYGWLIFTVGLGSFMGATANRRASQVFELQHIILYAILFTVLMALLLNALALGWFNAWVILIPLFLMRIAGGLTYSNCVTEGLAQMPEHSGSISSLYGIVITAGGAIISIIVARLPQYKQWTLSGSLFVEVGLMLLILILLRSKLVRKA